MAVLLHSERVVQATGPPVHFSLAQEPKLSLMLCYQPGLLESLINRNW